ncbi:protein of unknown function [Alkalibacterium putridalgicola]|uniref:DUF3284 domain-containing protein n=1 Tax=Alkalibacterium putridalgicola TaxID=426703 RepID=A0A1H7V2F3_9LACT|nr:DUF3284 domain-containing protein [Alkalibacterium putridalgicola]GEK89672.1 hypothetical protein APU01nite_17110 [Alkalibacterium putridalgicola]SEM03392.1 protein of unknown function [Alkalibacterium putridalgicola]
MEFKRKMNMSAEQLFNTITRSVLYDIEEQTGKSVSTDQIEGFEYTKTFGKNSRATIQIDQVEENKSYHYRTKTTKNDFLVKYDIEPLSEGSCRVTYTEELESYGHMQKLNDALVGTLLSYFRKKRLKLMLESMEKA